MSVINVHDFKTHYSKYLDQVKDGKEIVLGKHGKAIAKVVPLSDPHEKRLPGGLKDSIWVSDDFDEPMMWMWDELKEKP